MEFYARREENTLKIRGFLRSLSLKQIVFSLIFFLFLLLYLILTIWINKKTGSLMDQQVARRWDEEGGSAQVSCFLAEGVEMDEFKIRDFEQKLEQNLLEVSSELREDQEEQKRLFIDAYSSLGRITVVSEKGNLEASAVGIGGDFFLFHPLQLVSGGYFSGDNLMKDAIVLDEDAAWQLFGSSDIAGKSVMIGGVPHYISGVVKRQEDRFAEGAGLSETIVYLSNESLLAYGESGGVSIYEVTAPNPVKGFLANCVKEHLGVEERDMLLVENSARYKTEALLPVILSFGTRSMQNYAVKLPYWENVGRGWEDIAALVLIFRCLFLLIPAVIFIAFLIIKWKNRNFTFKDIRNFVVDTKDKMVQKAHSEKNKWEHF